MSKNKNWWRRITRTLVCPICDKKIECSTHGLMMDALMHYNLDHRHLSASEPPTSMGCFCGETFGVYLCWGTAQSVEKHLDSEWNKSGIRGATKFLEKHYRQSKAVEILGSF
jgi:hypothetical protein